MTKLNQVIAVEKGVKSRVKSDLTTIYHAVKKPELFTGFVKTFRKTNDEADDRPGEKKKVQLRANDVLETVSETLVELFNVTAQKDYANCEATADVVVDGQTILKDVPPTYLLFLEKQLTDVKTLLLSLPVLSSDEDWTRDDAAGLFKTEPVTTQSTKKVQKALVLHPATKEHPAQTQLVTEDVVVGHWDTVKQSGALVADEKKRLVKRTENLIKAVKFARESANETTAAPQNVGENILGYLFG